MSLSFLKFVKTLSSALSNALVSIRLRSFAEMPFERAAQLEGLGTNPPDSMTARHCCRVSLINIESWPKKFDSLC